MQNTDKLDAIIQPALVAARVPGAAIAIVADERVIFARGYGYRDLHTKLEMTPDTVYPIASTTKAINAALLAMLVQRRVLEWDEPVRTYLPELRLHDPIASAAVTIRDLVTMRTGLPRHDMVWVENPISRAELVGALAHLQPSAAFRERFQYNNLTVTLAAHIAEVVTGQSWEDMVRTNVLEPLQMVNTTFSLPDTENATASYHEGPNRELVRTRRLDTRLAAPAGGTIHSTISDMSRWVRLNLSGGKVAGRQLIEPKVLTELHSPWVMMGADPLAPSPNAAYGLGWMVDTYNGRVRISHGGDLHDVISCVTLFPEDRIGIVSFVNLSVPRFARALNQCAFDVLMGIESDLAISKALLEYEQRIANTRARNAQVPRVANTTPSHDLNDYVGSYFNAGYGRVAIRRSGEGLILERCNLRVTIEHWHYDAWVAADSDQFPICKPHPFERASRIVFETSADGSIVALLIQFEPATAPIRFEKREMVR